MKKVLMSIMLLLCVFGLSACDSDATTSTEQSNETNENVEKKTTYSMNEDIYIKNSSGEYRIKITGVRETNERNKYSDTQANKVVIISYEYENISQTDDLYVSSMSFNAYDKDNNALETYEVIDYKYPSDVSSGRKTTAEMVYALNNNSNYIELEYYDNMFNSSADCIIKLEW